MVRAFRNAARVCPVLLTASCGGTEPPPVQPKAPPVAQVEPPSATFTSPAKWSFHPSTPTTATAAVVLPDGSCVFTTDEGLRFRSTKGSRSSSGAITCRGQTTAATDIVPDSLVGIVERPGSSWMFVGESGNLYEAEGPMEPFRRIIGAPTSFAKVTGSNKTILAVTYGGELFRLDETSTWSPVNVAGARLFDVAVSDEGQALALALPEKLFTSEDGQKFVPAPSLGTIGARRVGRTSTGNLGVQGLTETIVWAPKESPAFSRTSDGTSTASVALELDSSVVPTASAVVEGRAAFDGDRYVEAVLLDDEGGNWRLASGRFDGPLSLTPLRQTSDCVAMRVGARGRQVTTACIKTDDDGNFVALVRMSDDGGQKFGEELRLAAGDGEMVGVAVSNDGSALVTGVCKVRSGGTGCAGSPPLLLKSEAGVITTTLAAAPPLMGVPISPAFSNDARSAYFLARRAKDERLTLYVSHDAGRTFAERSLDARAERTTRDLVGTPDDDSFPSDESLEPSDLTTLRASDDGTLGMVLTTSRGLSYLTTDEDGRVLAVTEAPTEKAIMGGYGRRALAISLSAERSTAGEDAVIAWESGDGGAGWNELSVTRALTREIVAGPMTMACSSAGCLVGSTVTRVGWEGQTDPPSITIPKATVLEPVNAVRTPLVCTLDPKTPWKRIDHVWSGFGLPMLYDTARGRVLWSLLSYDPETSAISTTIAQLPERGDGPARITTRSLFAATPKGAKYAVDVSNQVEGYAATRVRIPDGQLLSAPMRNVEVAWENFVDGTSGRTTIPDAGYFSKGDVSTSSSDRLVLDTALMSVTTGAVFVRPHSQAASDDRLFLMDTKGKRSTFAFPNLESLLGLGKTNMRTDTALVEGKPLIVGTVDELEGDTFGPLTMVLARATENGSWKATATSLFPTMSKDRARQFLHDWTYRGTEVGVVATISEPREGRAASLFVPFRADGTFGAPTELPTPYDLPALPRPCKADERRTTARLAAHGFSNSEAMYPGHRHPVLVTEVQKDKPSLSEPIVLLTSGVVLHGTKDAPCVAAWDAYGVTQVGLGAVIAGDPSQAWLFRRVQVESTEPGTRPGEVITRSSGQMVEHRPMTCRFDSSANVPDSVWNHPGTHRLPTK